MIRKSSIAKIASELRRDLHSRDCGGLAPLLFSILVCISLASCRTTQYIPVPSSHSSIDVSLRYDSIIHTHNRFIFLRGDTVYIHETDSVEKLVKSNDTIIIRDSIPKIVPVPVPGEMTKRQAFLYNTGISAWIVLAVLALAGIIYVFVKAIK